jgi:hypothetical protein
MVASGTLMFDTSLMTTSESALLPVLLKKIKNKGKRSQKDF